MSILYKYYRIFLVLVLVASYVFLFSNIVLEYDTHTIKLNNPILFHVKSINTNKSNDFIDKEDILKLKNLMQCKDKEYKYGILQRGEFWVLKNFVKAGHGPKHCYENITYATQGDFRFLFNLETTVKRWRAPISAAVYAPGDDFDVTINTIRYLRDCSPEGRLIRELVSFHLFFDRLHVPERISEMNSLLYEHYDCSSIAPYLNVNASKLYKVKNNLLYPVNIARNIAVDASMTHYHLLLDIELYPSPFLEARFFNMILKDSNLLTEGNPKVFVLIPFEVKEGQQIPDNKTQLVEMLKQDNAHPFGHNVCPPCQNVPHTAKWMELKETSELRPMGIGKRIGAYASWEPIYICTQNEPQFDEKFFWEGMSDKMSSSYILCVLNYDFLILNNAFVTHHPGYIFYNLTYERGIQMWIQGVYKMEQLLPQILRLYGKRKGCKM